VELMADETKQRDVPIWRGKPVDPDTIVSAWTRGTERMKDRSARIVETRGLRRGTLTVALSADFTAKHPHVAANALSLMPQREGLERDLIAKAGAAIPKPSRAPLDATETAVRLAEEYESYIGECAKSERGGVPFSVFIEKGVEDAEFGIVSFPSDLDEDGLPDFYDRIDERAYAQMKAEQRQEYRPDTNRRGKYARFDQDGNRKPNPKWDRDARGQKPKDPKDRDDKKSKEAHNEAERKYLLSRAPTAHRVIPALDCVPYLVRGKGTRRWEPVALVERRLVEPEELERSYGWAMLGNNLLLPRGFDQTLSGNSGQFYLYSLYYVQTDKDGIERTICCYTVGGAGTWHAWAGEDERQQDAVACIDLYRDRGLTGRFFDYFHALHTSDDDPNWYGRPYLWSLKNRILNIEGLETAANAAVQLQAYTGYYHKPDAALAKEDPESVVDGRTGELRRPKVPGPGDIETVTGDVFPAQQARIGEDAWRLQQNYLQSLTEATLIDQMPTSGPSGNAMLISESLGQVAKRHIKEAALAAWEFCVQADARIRHAAFTEHGIKWPINTTKERPVGIKTITGQDVAEWDPDWIGDGNFWITGEYDQEFNLARADLEMNAYLKGVRGLKHVAAAFGEADVMTLRVELAKDALWKEPESQMLLRSLVDNLRGMKRQRAALMLQAEQRMTQQGLPGAELGMPKTMMARPGDQQQQGGAPTGAGPQIGASARGGIKAGAMGAAADQLDALGALGAA
jgi:hypothetical protein